MHHKIDDEMAALATPNVAALVNKIRCPDDDQGVGG